MPGSLNYEIKLGLLATFEGVGFHQRACKQRSLRSHGGIKPLADAQQIGGATGGEGFSPPLLLGGAAMGITS